MNWGTMVKHKAKKPTWTDDRQKIEGQAAFERRMQRRAAIREARENAETVVIDGREFTLVRLEPETETLR